jgi:hypothetical protein
MTQFPHPPHPPAIDRIRFACGSCGASLEVPAALAGVQGPCPLCGKVATAPSLENSVATGDAARLLARPPLRRDIPPPMAPVDEIRLPAPMIRPLPIRDETPPAQNLPASPSPDSEWSIPEAAPGSAATPSFATAFPTPDSKELISGNVGRNHILQRLPSRERGVFAESADVNGHLLDTKPPAPSLRRHGWRRWVDIAIVSVFTGLLVATVAALRFTVPMENLKLPGLPENLNELVERETLSQRLREQEAGALACASVNRYLGAGSEQAAASHLLPPPEGIAAPAYPPFPGLQVPEWMPVMSKRIPFTDRYVITVQPKEEPGPVFVVEETDSGPRLHPGPVTQQCSGLFEKFTATPGEGEATLYVEVCPTPAEGERNYRLQRPDLAPYRFVDVRNAFPSAERREWIFCLQPDGEAARDFAHRVARDPGWRRALVQVRWHQHREAGPWAEVVKFIPGVWSGDPPASLPSITASASP